MISILISLLILCLVAFAAVLLAHIVDVERLDRADGDAPVEPRRRQSAWPPRRNQEPEP